VKKILNVLALSVLAFSVFAQGGAKDSTARPATPAVVIDKIIAKVDNYYVLKSELDLTYEQYKAQGQPNAPTQCQILESLILNKFLVAKAEIDSVTVPDKQVENELTGRMDQMAMQYGSEKGIVEQFGKSIDQLKAEYRAQVREQLLGREMQRKITEDVKITPKEVRQFFNAIPKDSIPYLPTEVEVGQIVRLAKVTREEKSRLRQRLIDIKKRVEAGEDFAKLAKEYSEDVGSAQNGGNLGFAKRGMMVPTFEAAAMKLKPGQMSDIVESDFGFHLIQLIELRGQEYNARHILLRPEYARLDLTEPTRFLDSIRTLLVKDSLKFDKAARDFSEDKNTAEAGGLLRDRESGSNKLALDASMEPTLYFILDTMKVGAFSKPLEFRTDDGKSAVRILYYKTKYPPHYANLKDDYQKLANFALSRKRNTAVEKWFAKSKGEVFIQIDPEYRDCPTVQNLLASGQ
jgi:peptidyl-prolyl cis-trans isomerase SurA